MSKGVSPPHFSALSSLRFECDYEDDRTGRTDNFILRGKLPTRTGIKTLQDLEAWGLIISGPNRWFNETGYRITDLGRVLLGTSEHGDEVGRITR